MELRELRLDQFRNYASLCLPFGPGMHVFAGANAQGKTNLLEAVYVTATGRSPRVRQEGNLVAWDAEIARAVGTFHSDMRGEFAVEVSLARKGGSEPPARGTAVDKRIKVNGVPRQVADLAGLVPVVLFLTEDLEIIRGEPARRRDFLDTDLSGMSRSYAWALRQYTRVVEHRNRLLKDIREGLVDPELLPSWNEQLATYGGRLLEVRVRFTEELSAVCGPTYEGLTASAQRMALHYRREGEADAGEPPATREAFTAWLSGETARLEAEEIRRGSSLVGPHRDDVQILVDGRDIRQFGSQGEQRTAALALRVAEFSLMQRLVGEPPVLLLDDILSELDRTRRAALLAHLSPIAQVIMTTTDVDAVGLPPHAAVHLYRVDGGTVAPM